LILILHKLPIAGSSQRELGMFWRSSDGTWKSNELGGGIQALQQHVNEYGNRALELEDMENKAVAADDFFYVRNEINPARSPRSQEHVRRDISDLRSTAHGYERRAAALFGLRA